MWPIAQPREAQWTYEECDVRRLKKKEQYFVFVLPSPLARVNPGQAAWCVWSSQHKKLRGSGGVGKQVGRAVDGPKRGLVRPLRALLHSATLGSRGTGDREPATLRCPRPVTQTHTHTRTSDVSTINKRSNLTIINTCKRTNMRTLTLTSLEQYPRIYAALAGEIPNQILTGDS